MLGPAPAEKLRSSPPWGQGVTSEFTVLPSPGMLIHNKLLTDVFRAACPASMDTTPWSVALHET